MSDLILALSDERVLVPNCGGKAANLSVLSRAGLPVPGGFVVTTAAYRAFVNTNQLQTKLMEAASIDDCQAASKECLKLFHQASLPKSLRTALKEQYEKLGRNVAVAVRSSGTAEDMDGMSFAGQHDTFLGVRSWASLCEKIVECFASMFSARAIDYRRMQKVSNDDLALAVVVQQMVDSHVAGVLFTLNPGNGDRDEFTLDISWGLGEALVSGQVVPDHYVLSALDGSVLKSECGSKLITLHFNDTFDGVVETRREEASTTLCASDALLKKLWAAARRIMHDVYGGVPQDIEFGATVDDELFILQARPVTTCMEPVKIPPSYRKDNQNIVCFSFASAQGVFTPLPPMTLSLWRRAIAGAVAHITRRTRVDRPYLVESNYRLWMNITDIIRHPWTRGVFLKHGVRAALPGVQKVEELANVRGLEPRTNELGWQLAFFLRIVRFILLHCHLAFLSFCFPEYSAQRYENSIDAFLSEMEETAERATDRHSIASLFTTFDRLAPLIASNLPFVIGPFGISMKILSFVIGAEEAERVHLENILRYLPGNVTTQMNISLDNVVEVVRADDALVRLFKEESAERLAQMYNRRELNPAFNDALDDFLRHYGARSAGEICISEPRWREEVSKVMTMISSSLVSSRSVLSVLEEARASAEQTIVDISDSVRTHFTTIGALIPYWGAFKAMLCRFWVRRCTVLMGKRESHKFAIVRAFAILRTKLLALGNEFVSLDVLDNQNDIFLLDDGQVEAMCSLDTEVATRACEGANVDVNSPNVIGGQGVSMGVYEGVVRKLTSPAEKLKKGEIMVCEGTDPGWTPLFLTAGALVTRVGGWLTHGSIVAREYGLPAVVGVDIDRLNDGERVLLDGTNGVIKLLERERVSK